MARLVVAAAAAVVVGYFAGPVAGLQTFAVVYGATGFLDPNKKVLGPKLSDLKAPQASYGAPIAYVEGAPRLAGCIIWASEKHEIANTTTQGGKGGPGVDSTTFTYEMDVLYELAINRCEAVRRIWSNGKLVWTKADDTDAASISASERTAAWRDLRFYDGDPDQLPDPTYEAAVGVGNAPAYRTRTTLMIEGLNLGGSGQMPILTFEVVSEADTPYVGLPLAHVPDITYAPASGISAFSLSDPVYIFAPWDINTLSGFVNSYQVWRIDEPGGEPISYNGVDVGFQEHTHVTLLGNSDESLYLLMVRPGFGAVTGEVDAYNIDGAFTRFDLSDIVNGAPFIFSKVGTDIVFAATFNSITAPPSNDGKLRRFNRTTGALLATSASALPEPVQGLAIGGGFVYALSYQGDEVYKCDLATLALVDTYAIPSIWNAGIASGHVMCDGSDLYVLGAGSANWQPAFIHWDGAAWEIVAYGQSLGLPHDPEPVPTLIDLYSPPSAYGAANVVDGVLFGRVVNIDHDVSYLSSTVAIVLPRLDQVVRRLCLRTGLLLDADIDVTDLSHDVAIADGYVRAMAISQVSSTRATIETLMAAYLFEAVEGEKLRFVRRGGSSVATIPYDRLGAGADGSEEPLAIKRVNDIEIAARVSVRYANTLNDFQDGIEAADRLVTDSTAEQVVEIPLGFEPLEAKKLADCNTLDLAVSLIQLGPVALPRLYSALEPTDVITVTDLEGSTFRTRIVKGTIGAGRLVFDLALDDATVINSEAATDEDYTASTLVRSTAATDLELLDIPLLRDADNGPGFYAAFGASGAWAGAELDSSPDDVTYTKVLEVSDVAVMGDATTILGDFDGGNVFDEINALTVDVGEGTLSSTTSEALLTTTDSGLLVGSEIIQFRDATLDSPGVYTLRGLLRGRRGTEWAIPDHVADERVVLLKASSGIRHVVENAADINVPHYYKAVTFGRSRASAAAELFTDTGVSLKPFAPVNIEAAASGSQDIVLTWQRRSRLSSVLFGTTPLGETTEAYSIDVFSGATLLRTLTSSTTAATYTAAQQGLDGVAAGDPLSFDVYQLSATVGRGYPGTTLGAGRRQALPQIAEVTLGGTFASGTALYVTIGSSRFDYTTTVGDSTLSGAATSLAALIDAAADYSASAVGPVVTITGPVSVSEPVNARLNAGDNTMTLGVTQTASPIVAGHREEFNYTVLWADSSAINPLSVLQVVMTRISDGMNRNYSGSPTTSAAAFATPTLLDSIHSAFVASGDRAAFDLDNARIDDITSRLFTPLADPLNWTLALYSSDPNMILGSSSRGVGVTDIPVARPQISTIALAGTPTVGWTYRATLGGADLDYTAGGGDTTMTLVAAGLAAVIDAHADYSATSAGPVITVTGAVANVPFSMAWSILTSTITVAAAITQTAS